MPLLHRKPFEPRQVPDDLKADEEVFVCSYTKEAFRNYEDFFNRQFLCKTSAWSCELTGQHNLTYEQAIKSEREANETLNSIQDCYKKAILSLLHHTYRTNIKTVVGEVSTFFKDRYIVGEEVEYYFTPGDKRSAKRVKVLSVIQPKPSPVKVSVITNSPQNKSPTSKLSISPLSETPTKTTQAIDTPMTDSNEGLTTAPVAVDLPLFSTPSEKVTPNKLATASPISSQLKLNSADYQYLVQFITDPDHKFTTSATKLSRPKTALTREKIKLFLRNSLHRESDRHPLLVKQEYIQKFQLGPTSIKPDLSLVSTPGSHKRSMSQTSMDSFLSQSLKDARKPRLTTLTPLLTSMLPKKQRKSLKTPTTKSPHRSKKGRSSKSPSKKTKTTKTPKSSKTPKMKPSTQTPASIGAKKVLKKVKHFKQLDLRKNLVKKKGMEPLTEEEMFDLRRKSAEEKSHSVAEKAALKEKQKQERSRKSQELRAKRRLEKQKQMEWLKPREDLSCDDSKPLPQVSTLTSRLPANLFGDAIMILEFLHHYGPSFNIKDAIRGPITYENIEEAIVSSSLDNLLFDIMKFLLQAIFVVMEDEHELDKMTSVAVPEEDNVVTTATEDGRERTGSTSRTDSRRSSVGSIPVEGMEEEQQRPLDVRVAALKTSASEYVRWSQFTQATPLQKLIFNPYTYTEVLRLHLLSSGGYKGGSERQWFRYCNRGGYTDSDDPILELRLTYPHITDSLSAKSVYSLSPDDKLCILSGLCSQLLMSASTRYFMYETLTQSKQLRRQIRLLQFSLTENKKKKSKSKNKEAMDVPVVEEKSPKENQSINGTTLLQETQPKSIEGGKNTPPVKKLKTRSQGPATPNEKNRNVAKNEDEEKEESETKEEKKARVRLEIESLEEELIPVAATLNLTPLGCDRFHNKYWMFPTLPGLYVEHSVTNHPVVTLINGSSISHTTSPVKEMPFMNTTLHNQVSSSSTILPGTDQIDLTSSSCKTDQCIDINSDLSSDLHHSSSPAVTCNPERLNDLSNSSEYRWSCISSEKQLDQLIMSLNPRGIRESKLKQMLEKRRSLIISSIAMCPFITQSSEVDSQSPECKSADEFLELYLREQILDLEEKIYIGNLGFIKDIKSRRKWRERIETSGAASVYAAEETENKITNGDEMDDSEEEEEEEEEDEEISASPVTQLAKALLQIQSGIEKKGLLPPLGTAVDVKKKGKDGKKNGLTKDPHLCLEQWRSSLQKATSISQIFVHLSTLERAIAWSKSLMNVRCRICRRKGGDEYMLLCDGCDHGYHMYCLRPPLHHVPDGDWFCYDCCPVTPVKRKRTLSLVNMKELSDSESESEEEEEEEVEDEDEEYNEEESDAEEVERRGLRASTRIQRKSFQTCVKKPKLETKAKRKSNQVQISRKRKSSDTGNPPQPDLSRVKKKLRLDDSSSSKPHLSRAEIIISSIIDVRCSKKQGPSQGKAQHTLELQLCKALLEELVVHGDSWPFLHPVRRRECPDYYEIVSRPMDFKTISQKISSNKYSGLNQFLLDIDLVFSNCSAYHKRHSKTAKAGASLRRFLEQRYSDLGLRNLADVNISGLLNLPELRSSSRRSS